MKIEDNKRYRNWTLLVYPESAPEDWQKQIESLRIRWIKSPLHDKDVDEDGKIKKAHWHVLLLFDGVKSFDVVKQITTTINSPRPEVCQSAQAMVRYFVHKDDPDKYQYSESDVMGYGGVDVAKYLNSSTAESRDVTTQILKYIRENDVDEFKDLIDSIIDDANTVWLDQVYNHNAFIIISYISSLRYKKERGKK